MKNLLGINPLCNSVLRVIFDKYAADVQLKGKTILTGWRNKPTVLWQLNLKPAHSTTPQPKKFVVNSAYDTSTISDLIGFLHAAAFSPVKATWTAVIKKGFSKSCTGLTAEYVKKQLNKSTATTMVHLDQKRKNISSTKPINPVNNQDIEIELHTTQ